MSAAAASSAPSRLGERSWRSANLEFVRLQLDRLRLLLRRRSLWLRHCWRDEPASNAPGVISDALVERVLAYGDLAAAVRFFRTDEVAREIGREVAVLARRAAALAEEMAADTAPPALLRLTERCELSEFERDVVLLAAAADLDPLFGPLFAHAQDDATRIRPTPGLAGSLLGAEGARDASLDAVARFAPGAPLRRLRLITLDPGGGFGIEERLLHYLLGVEDSDARIARCWTPMATALVSSDTHALAGRLARWLAPRRNHAGAINLVGTDGCGRAHLASAVCARMGRPLWRIDADAVRALGSSTDDVSVLLREMTLAGAAVVLEAGDAERTAAAVGRALGAGGPVFVSSSRPLELGADTLVVEVARPDRESQAALWRQALIAQDAGTTQGVRDLVQQFDLGPGSIERAVAVARETARLRAGERAPIEAADLWRACRMQGSGALDELAQPLVPVHTWTDLVVGPETALQLRELEAQVLGRGQVYDGWGFGTKLARGRGINALFSGPSGTGKTMAAEVLANAVGLALYRVDLASILSKYIGETPKHLKRVFDAAERIGAILFFDEADALFSRRTEVKDSHDRYANVEVNYLLQRMEEYAGVAILATNRRADFDRAFTRRLRFVVEFSPPDASARRRMWCKAFPDAAALEGLDFDALSRLDLTGGSIRNVALNAAFLAAAQGRAISMDHVQHAARREYAKLDQLPGGSLNDGRERRGVR